ncbi:MAG: hypothetical protein M1833_004519 [Piccolia ochrophora]|nr:MAG: hypothetical protein M1833_004519 [Piccolia ochrophora]
MVAPGDSDPFIILPSPNATQDVFREFQQHYSGQGSSAEVTVTKSIRAHHPDHTVTTILPFVDLLGFAAAGNAVSTLDDRDNAFLRYRVFYPAPRQAEHAHGDVVDIVEFAKYFYRWREHDFIYYKTPIFLRGYIVCKPADGESVSSHSQLADDLIVAASEWQRSLRHEILVYDRFWRKDPKLWQGVQGTTWDDVILDDDVKKAMVEDVEGFYDQKDTYKEFQVPWKRGIIWHGPPGNGKTLSIKALMHTLSETKPLVAPLYVKGFVSDWDISQIFAQARLYAPCLLIFEDLDSFVHSSNRSYFFNEVDGLDNNDGILMLATTNYLDNLDPGLSKRPSRFDRKYLFPDPVFSQRVQYSEYWRQKLKSNPKIDFPKKLNRAVAKITDGFSFAYLKEAFVSALLALVHDRKHRGGTRSLREVVDGVHEGDDGSGGGGGDDDLDDVPLWVELRKQIRTLRDEMGGAGSGSVCSKDAKKEAQRWLLGGEKRVTVCHGEE